MEAWPSGYSITSASRTLWKRGWGDNKSQSIKNMSPRNFTSYIHEVLTTLVFKRRLNKDNSNTHTKIRQAGLASAPYIQHLPWIKQDNVFSLQQ